MKSYLILLSALAVAIAALAAPVRADSVVDVTDTVKEIFRVRSGGTLIVDVDHGNIVVETIRANEVRIELERTVSVSDADEAKRILERHEYQFEQDGNDVLIRSQIDSDGWFWSRRGRERLRIKATIQVPEQYNVEFSAGAGNVSVADLGGSVSGRTGAGNIVLGMMNGSIEISTGSGNVDASGARGAVKVSTGAGNVNLQNVYGALEVTSGAGNISAFIRDQPHEQSVLETGAGNVTVHIRGGIRANVHATAGIGSASTDFPLTVEGKWMSKSFAGDLNGGGPSIRMRAGVGNVTLKRLR